MSDDTITINLRAIRAKAGLSLSATQDLTGVSKAMLGQIERGESSPTIATLWKLAKGFHLPLTAFITDPGLPAEDTIAFPESITVQTLFAFAPALGNESFMITLAPGQSHESRAHDKGVIEDVVAIHGKIEVLHGGTWHPLAPGEALRFAADQPHGYRTIGNTGARFHNTIHYPEPLASPSAIP
jgi:transcriptional regulator with XRE-family HTH domain